MERWSVRLLFPAGPTGRGYKGSSLSEPISVCLEAAHEPRLTYVPLSLFELMPGIGHNRSVAGGFLRPYSYDAHIAMV